MSSLCYFVLVVFSPFSIAVTSLGEEGADLSAFHTFVRFVLVWFCLFPLPLGIWVGLRFVIVTLPGLFSYLFYAVCRIITISLKALYSSKIDILLSKKGLIFIDILEAYNIVKAYSRHPSLASREISL